MAQFPGQIQAMQKQAIRIYFGVLAELILESSLSRWEFYIFQVLSCIKEILTVKRPSFLQKGIRFIMPYQ